MAPRRPRSGQCSLGEVWLGLGGVGARARRGLPRIIHYFVVVNVHVVEPWPDAFDPVAFAVYAVAFFRRLAGVSVTVVHGELHVTDPFTARPVLSLSVMFEDVSGVSNVAVTAV